MLRARLLLLLGLQLLLQFLDLLLEEVSFVFPVDSLFLNVNLKMENQTCLVSKDILSLAVALSELLIKTTLD